MAEKFIESAIAAVETAADVISTVMETAAPVLETLSTLGKRSIDEVSTPPSSGNPTTWINCTTNHVRFFDSKQTGVDWIAAGKPDDFPGMEVFKPSGVVLNATGRDRKFTAIVNGKRYNSCKPKKFNAMSGLDELDDFISDLDLEGCVSHDDCNNIILIVSTITADNWDDLVEDSCCLLAVPNSSFSDGVFEKKPDGSSQIQGTTQWIFYCPSNSGGISIPYYKGDKPDIYLPSSD